jgi:hypothetical protein
LKVLFHDDLLRASGFGAPFPSFLMGPAASNADRGIPLTLLARFHPLAR